MLFILLYIYCRYCIKINKFFVQYCVAPLWERGLKSLIFSISAPQNRSLLSWERGLKFVSFNVFNTSLLVAPLVGAWIEISEQVANGTAVTSLLSWERGLKFAVACNFLPDSVAPLVGAWIEIPYLNEYECEGCCRSSRGSVD